MEDKEYNSLSQADELRKCGIEIDELQARSTKSKNRDRGVSAIQFDEVRMKIQIARDKLINIYNSIRSENLIECVETTSNSTSRLVEINESRSQMKQSEFK